MADNPTKGRGRKHGQLGPRHRMPFGKYKGLMPLRYLAKQDPEYLMSLVETTKVEFTDGLWFLIESNLENKS